MRGPVTAWALVRGPGMWELVIPGLVTLLIIEGTNTRPVRENVSGGVIGPVLIKGL